MVLKICLDWYLSLPGFLWTIKVNSLALVLRDVILHTSLVTISRSVADRQVGVSKVNTAVMGIYLFIFFPSDRQSSYLCCNVVH